MTLREEFIQFYQRSGRSFPWRETKDLYRLIVTEILLKRTTAKKVEKIWDTFFQKYPNPDTLAHANEIDIKNIIQNLGLQRNRSRELKLVAKKFDDFQGQDEMLQVHSIGQYISGSVAIQIGLTWADPPVDVNVERVLSRYLGSGAFGGKEFEYYTKLYNEGDLREILYGILDLAALRCHPSNPDCISCPLSTKCKFNSNSIDVNYSFKYTTNSSLVIVLSPKEYKLLKGEGLLALPKTKFRNKLGFVYVKVPTKSFVGRVNIAHRKETIEIHSFQPFRKFIPLSYFQNISRCIILRFPFTWINPRSEFQKLLKNYGAPIGVKK